jgi:choline dehydrogenase-like flavoprotein
LRPKSRGSLTLASGDPLVPPRILMNFLADADDRRVMRRGIGICREIAATKAFAPLLGEPIAPGRNVASDTDLDAYLRQGVESIYHPCGSCRMGADDDSVVDPELRVRGVSGLRVVDASVMPDNIGATINAGVMAIAERASDIIRGLIDVNSPAELQHR